MAFENGRLYACDRCSATAFVKTIGDGEADGGYTRWNKFEPLVGWHSSLEAGLLCPKCADRWKRLVQQFKSDLEM